MARKRSPAGGLRNPSRKLVCIVEGRGEIAAVPAELGGGSLGTKANRSRASFTVRPLPLKPLLRLETQRAMQVWAGSLNYTRWIPELA